jgi:hypothetical protein
VAFDSFAYSNFHVVLKGKYMKVVDSSFGILFSGSLDHPSRKTMNHTEGESNSSVATKLVARLFRFDNLNDIMNYAIDIATSTGHREDRDERHSQHSQQPCKFSCFLHSISFSPLHLTFEAEQEFMLIVEKTKVGKAIIALLFPFLLQLLQKYMTKSTRTVAEGEQNRKETMVSQANASTQDRSIMNDDNDCNDDDVQSSEDTTTATGSEHADSETSQSQKQHDADAGYVGAARGKRRQNGSGSGNNDHGEAQDSSGSICENKDWTEFGENAIYTATVRNEDDFLCAERTPDSYATPTASSTDEPSTQGDGYCSDQNNKARGPVKSLSSMQQNNAATISNIRRTRKSKSQQSTPTSALHTLEKQDQREGSIVHLPGIMPRKSPEEKKHQVPKLPELSPIRRSGAQQQGRTTTSSKRVKDFLVPACVAGLVFAVLQSPAYLRSQNITLEQECHSLPIYALIGKTGVGKSSFIKALSGKDSHGHEAVVCHSMDSCKPYSSSALLNCSQMMLNQPSAQARVRLTTSK